MWLKFTRSLNVIPEDCTAGFTLDCPRIEMSTICMMFAKSWSKNLNDFLKSDWLHVHHCKFIITLYHHCPDLSLLILLPWAPNSQNHGRSQGHTCDPWRPSWPSQSWYAAALILGKPRLDQHQRMQQQVLIAHAAQDDGQCKYRHVLWKQTSQFCLLLTPSQEAYILLPDVWSFHNLSFMRLKPNN